MNNREHRDNDERAFFLTRRSTTSIDKKVLLATDSDSDTYSSLIMSLPVEAIQTLADEHPKPSRLHFQYGTAGFRTLYVVQEALRAQI